MRTLLALTASLALVLAVAACDSSGGDGDGTQDVVTGNQDDTGGNGNGNGLPPVDNPDYDISGITFPEGEVPDTPLEPNPQCGEVNDAELGETVEWKGWIFEGDQYTCNWCPGGVEPWQGEWRAWDGENPDNPLPSDRPLSKWTIDGNTWHIRMRGNDSGLEGSPLVDMTMSGWYFCSDQPENEKKVYVFITENVEPEGAFGNVSGMMWSADMLMTDSAVPTSIYMYMYFDRVATTDTDDQYADGFLCKVGQEMGGGTCDDPFNP